MWQGLDEDKAVLTTDDLIGIMIYALVNLSNDACDSLLVQMRLLEEFTSKEQQNSREGLAFFSLKVALDHLVAMEISTRLDSSEPVVVRTPRKQPS